MNHDPKTTDAMLREYLEGKPSELLSKLFDEHQAAEARRQSWCEEHERKDDSRHMLVIAALGGHDARIAHVESKLPSRAPPSLERYRSPEGSGSFHIPEHELKAALRSVEAGDALEQKQAIYRGAGKVALALVTAGALFAAGTLWRDLAGPRMPTTSTSITTISPGQK